MQYTYDPWAIPGTFFETSSVVQKLVTFTLSFLSSNERNKVTYQKDDFPQEWSLFGIRIYQNFLEGFLLFSSLILQYIKEVRCSSVKNFLYWVS